MQLIDDFLDKITMYRLVLYYLIFLLGVADIFGFVGILHLNYLGLLFSILFLIAVCWITNKIFAKTFSAPTNVESVYLTALILALIISPAHSVQDMFFLFWAGVLSMSSKYILALNRKHFFNPAAIAVVITSLAGVGSASWWVGTLPMLPFVLFGLLIVRKIRRYELVMYFLLAAVMTIFLFSFMRNGNVLTPITQTFFTSAILFFAFTMLTEPLTTPPTKNLQGIYGALVGVLFAPQFHLGSFFTTPELALVIGNIYAYFVSPKEKLVAAVHEKVQTTPGMVDFIFLPEKKIKFLPGQYMEWTLPHKNTDERGNRRYFTIASSPTEDTLRLGVKFYPNSSSFKKSLLTMGKNDLIVGGQISGDFVLPKDETKRLVFIAGGIGITPFRSIVKYLLDTKQKRPITLFYVNKTEDEIIYKDIFDEATKELGIKVVYTLTDKDKAPANWKGTVGRIDANMIASQVPDYQDCIFYLSGPHAMVVAYEDTLKIMGVSGSHIKKDFFPGLV
ncbi:MAG TPA: RnfABCDGE type electron transport complex subunit D [Patescibacteria group bacterium]